MAIPGQNILNMALTLIARQTISYYKDAGRQPNVVGQYVTYYFPPVAIVGSFQPVPRRLYEQYGLDLQKNYFTFYTSNNLEDISRDVSGDQIVFNNRRYQCESNNDWFALDGWKGVLCVEITGSIDDLLIFGFNQIPEINNNTNFESGNFDA
jgi:hypothetical protein